jgi:acyl-coenzyme A synthetase/AMP-(fatty) acid ligase
MDSSLPAVDQEALCRRLGIPTLLSRDSAGHPLDDGVTARHFAVAPSLPPTGTCLVKLTSGSTGDPLAPCFGEEELLVGIHQIAAAMDLGARHRVLIAIPLSHSYGFDNGLLSLAVLGTSLVLEPGFYPASILRALGRSEATFLPLVPPLVRGLGQVEWPQGLALETVVCAGAVLRPEAAEDFRRRSGRPVHNFYGSSETGGITFEQQPVQPAAVGTVGHPLPGVTIRLAEGNAVVIDSAANRIGLFGQHSRPLEDRQVRTGDTAEWSPEGRLRLTGRSADLLNIGGRKIAAARLEEALRSLPGVAEAAVVGMDDAARGERSVAFLVCDRWPIDTTTLPRRLTPREIRRIDALPYTQRGKLDRARLRDFL